MKTKKFFTDIQNFWAPKTRSVFAEIDIFCLLMSKIKFLSMSEFFGIPSTAKTFSFGAIKNMNVFEDSEEI